MPNDVINTVTVNGTAYGIGGGGHTIKNPAGTAMTQRSNLQFVDLTVTDDSTNDATKVESVHVIQSESELENLPDGLYMLNDDEDTVIDGNLVGYDNTNSDLNAENVQDAIDEVVETLDDKVDKVTSATNGNLAGLDATGNLTDSGWNGAKDTRNISGNPISITGLKSNQLAINPIITFEPIQAGSGTPSPDNIREISGYDKVEVESCGKNLVDESTIDSRDVTGTGTYRAGLAPILLKAGTYTISWASKTIDLYLTHLKDYSRDDVNTNPYTFTLSQTEWVMLRSGAYSTSQWNVVNPQIEESSSATTYEPYHKTTDLSESLGQTVYGLEYYPRTGKAEKTRIEIDMGDILWDYNSASNRMWFISPTIADAKIFPETDLSSIVCEVYATEKVNSIVNDTSLNCVIGISQNGRIVIRDLAYDNATTFKTAMTGKKIVYELKESAYTEIQLAPHEIALSSGYNYLSTNGTNISLAYHNGELATHADVEQLAETVNELENYIGASNKGTDVDISLYTSASSSYQFPKDGYLVVYGGSSTSGKIYVPLMGNDGGNFGGISMNITGASQMQTMFVKKGLKTYLAEKTASASNVAVVYRPLV